MLEAKMCFFSQTIIGIIKVDRKNPAVCKFLCQRMKKSQFVFGCNPHSSVALLNSVQPALSCTCTITVSHLYFSPKISPNLFEASLYLSWLSGRLVCSAHTQLCTPALKATFFANACFSRRLFVKCIMTCACPRAKSLC